MGIDTRKIDKDKRFWEGFVLGVLTAMPILIIFQFVLWSIVKAWLYTTH